jgi:hypothetical protein
MSGAQTGYVKRTLRGSSFALLCRVALAAVCYAVAIWTFSVVIEVWDTAPRAGSLFMTGLAVGGVVLVTRFALSAIVLDEDCLRARGVVRNWSVDRHDVTGIETEPFNGSVVARLRLHGGATVGLPWGVQGGLDEMSKLVACLEAWRALPDVDQKE